MGELTVATAGERRLHRVKVFTQQGFQLKSLKNDLRVLVDIMFMGKNNLEPFGPMWGKDPDHKVPGSLVSCHLSLLSIIKLAPKTILGSVSSSIMKLKTII